MNRTSFPRRTPSGYTPRVTIFGGRIDTDNPVHIEDASTVARLISGAGYGINNGGSDTGLMGIVAREAKSAGGSVFGVALSRYEPRPHASLEEYEGYDSHAERQHRLIELGDAFIALPGAIGTFHEILEVHILNILKEHRKPIVLVGEYFETYRKLIRSFEASGIMHADDTALYYAKDGREAASIIIEHFTRMMRDDISPKTYYPRLSSKEINTHLSRICAPYDILFERLVMRVFPSVYPSNRFRSSKLFARLVRETAPASGSRTSPVATAP